MYNNFEEFREAWIDALLSGKYMKGEEVLQEKNKFCCLGVAFDLLAKAEPEEYRWEQIPTSHRLLAVTGSYMANDRLTELAVPKWLSDFLLDDCAGKHETVEQCLIELNDTPDMTFVDVVKLLKEL